MFGNHLQVLITLLGAVAAASLDAALERGGTITAALGWRSVTPS
jgi:uncharacterized membrane protein YbjE (DUF340 family)